MVTRIICVDDDPVCLMLEKMAIKHSRITDEVHLTNNVEAALALLKNFDSLDNNQLSNDSLTLVFLDLNMPVLSGFDFLDALNACKEEYSDKVKVVIVSSSVDAREITRSKKYKSVIEFLSKPLTVNAILALGFSKALNT